MFAFFFKNICRITNPSIKTNAVSIKIGPTNLPNWAFMPWDLKGCIMLFTLKRVQRYDNYLLFVRLVRIKLLFYNVKHFDSSFNSSFCLVSIKPTRAEYLISETPCNNGLNKCICSATRWNGYSIVC